MIEFHELFAIFSATDSTDNDDGKGFTNSWASDLDIDYVNALCV